MRWNVRTFKSRYRPATQHDRIPPVAVYECRSSVVRERVGKSTKKRTEIAFARASSLPDVNALGKRRAGCFAMVPGDVSGHPRARTSSDESCPPFGPKAMSRKCGESKLNDTSALMSCVLDGCRTSGPRLWDVATRGPVSSGFDRILECTGAISIHSAITYKRVLVPYMLHATPFESEQETGSIADVQ